MPWRNVAIVHERAVRAEIFEEIVALAEAHAGVMGGDITLGIGQNPVVVRGAPDGSTTDAEHDAASVPEGPAMITDNAQAAAPWLPSWAFESLPDRDLARSTAHSPFPRCARTYNASPKLAGAPQDRWPPVTFSKSSL